MSNLTLVQNGATWPWDSNTSSVEFRPISGQTSPWQRYQMYNVTQNQPMWEYQGYSSASNGYDIQRNTSNDTWADDGGDYPSHFVVTGSTTQPTGQTTGGTYQATSTNKYLHIFIGTGSNHYVGYIDAWTSFQSGSGGGTSTEEVFVPNAQIVYYSGLTGRRFEQRGYPPASYELIGSSATHTWTLTSQSNNLQYHISGLSAGIWYLWQDSVLVATLGKSKVFCNFW